MNKLLVSIFTILLIIVLGELSYIVFLNGKVKPTSTPLAPEIRITAMPTPFPNHAIDINGLSMLTYWQKGVVYSARINVELKGNIAEIDTNGQIQEHGWPTFNYALKIKIKGENNKTNDVFLNQEELSKTVFKKVNAQNIMEPIDYKELKLNDKIQVFLILDLTKEFGNNFVSAEIIKL